MYYLLSFVDKCSPDRSFIRSGDHDYKKGSSRIDAHLIFPLFPENRKAIPKAFSGKKLLKKITLQILNFILIS